MPFFLKEDTIGATTTTKIYSGRIDVGSNVTYETDKRDVVPAKILFLTGK